MASGGRKRKQFKAAPAEMLGFKPAGETFFFSKAELLRAVCDILRTVFAKQQQAYDSPDIESKQTLDIDTQEVLKRYPHLGDNLPLLNSAFDLLCKDQVLQTGDRRGLKQRWCWMTVEAPDSVLNAYQARLNNELFPAMLRWRLW